MTNEDMLEDIKQLIGANNSTLLADFNATLNAKLAPINQKIDDLTDFVRDTIDTSNDATGEQLTDHEARITKLEKVTA